MTRRDVDDTISALRLAIKVKAKQGLTVNEVRIGKELARTIAAFNNFVTNSRIKDGHVQTIFGIPVVIDYERPMNLEIAVVEKIRVWETYGGEEDGRCEMDQDNN